MVLASDGGPDRSSDDADDVATTDGENVAAADGGNDVRFDEAALYEVVRRAVEDAILGVLGTLLLVGVAFVVVWAGFLLVAESTEPSLIAFGVAAIAFGFYLAAASLRVVPPAREWF